MHWIMDIGLLENKDKEHKMLTGKSAQGAGKLSVGCAGGEKCCRTMCVQ